MRAFSKPLCRQGETMLTHPTTPAHWTPVTNAPQNDVKLSMFRTGLLLSPSPRHPRPGRGLWEFMLVRACASARDEELPRSIIIYGRKSLSGVNAVPRTLEVLRTRD
eukprot:1184566-Prorocentrum_minimum.AAC.5